LKNHTARRLPRALRILLAVLLALALGAGGFLLWAADDYRAQPEALAVLHSGAGVTVQGDLTILTPPGGSDTGIVFYPGAKVEAAAYLPLLARFQAEGYTCVLVKMPLNLAIFDADAADAAFDAAPGVQHWYIAGHSMGGAMASSYASRHPDRVEGLILLGAYVYGDYPPQDALTIYGSLNADVAKHIDYTENILVIEGGNHAQFGNYGAQKGDLPAAISAEEQQRITAEAVRQFIESRHAAAQAA
jgi:pimeloyl-ACP methyl ester carboxylesterase